MRIHFIVQCLQFCFRSFLVQLVNNFFIQLSFLTKEKDLINKSEQNDRQLTQHKKLVKAVPIKRFSRKIIPEHDQESTEAESIKAANATNRGDLKKWVAAHPEI